VDRHRRRQQMAWEPLSHCQWPDRLPFFQYLKDEQAKGNKIRGREKHLSWGPGGEFRRWVWDNNESTAIRYSADSMRSTYYPEYLDQLSQSSSQSPTYGEDTTRHKASDPPSGHRTDHANSKQIKKRPKAKPQKPKPMRQSKTAKFVGPAPAAPTTTKKTTRKALPSASKEKAVNQIDPKLLRLHKLRISTLRPGRDRKHRRTGRTDRTT